MGREDPAYSSTRGGVGDVSVLSESVERLAAVREAAADPRAAYLIRSRLRRALLSCARGIAERQGVEKPVLPGQWSLAPDAPAEICEIIALCRRIYQSSEHLCQPSESFDVRWEGGWLSLQRDLGQLEIALERLA
jgi:hypothetical protein